MIKSNEIATISDDKTIKIWNIKSSKPKISATLKAKVSQIIANEVQKLLMVVGDDNKVSILDVGTL